MRAVSTALLLWVLTLAACDIEGTDPEIEDGISQEVSLTVQANISGTNIQAVTAEVTGLGIDVPITANFAISNGMASGKLTVPTGSERTFTVRAFDASAIETHRGSRTIPVEATDNATLQLDLASLVGTAPIEAMIGTHSITLTPSADTLAVGVSKQYKVAVTDAFGEIVATPELVWASLNPVVAAVDAAGMVTAGHVGDTNIVVSYRGIAAVAALVVE
jgi:uncharacterized protein YjdB